jgi:tRNA A-37 threonylcarbamoyl transferase component Bud32
MTWVVREAGLSPRLMALLGQPERALRMPERILKRSDAVTVWRDDGVVLKRWQPHTVLGLLKGLFRPSHAMRAFEKARRLESAGICTPKPVAAAARTSYGLPVASYFIMEEVADASDLAGWQASCGEAVQQTARLLAALHQAGFSHRDLKPTNLLFDRGGRAWLIDLDGLRVRGRISDAEAERDLAKLARRMIELASLSPREAAAFLRAYCRLRHRSKCSRWWHAIRHHMSPYLPITPRARNR